ncbi:MAG TPA: Ig-like domain-containing protein [Nocardioidaceae bacterium]|nr:Ig-like domain-containing protein [Nocardioidaceae bacterium]
MHVRKLMLPTLVLAVTAPLPFLGIQAEAAPAKCRKACDTTAPVVSIATPGAGSTVAGTVTVSGTASDNKALASVAVSVDGGAWATASGTSSWTWQWAAGSLPNGTHTIAAKAVDTSGNVQTASRTVTVSNTTADTTAPSVGFTTPTAGSTVNGTVSVAGTSADNAAVAKVEVKVDSGAWQSASGTATWSWSWATGGLAAGTHTLTARATDAAGNVNTATRSVTLGDASAPTVAITSPSAGSTVTGTVSVAGSASDDGGLSKVEVSVDGGAWSAASGTASWTWSWGTATVANGSHTLTVRATDTAGNASTTSRTVSVLNSSIAPSTQGSWTSPEGVRITVNSAGPWTIAGIYSMLKENALDLDKIGSTLTIQVQDEYSSQTQTSAVDYAGRYSGFTATMWLDGVTSGFSARPDDVFAHEYGHVWARYWFFMGNDGTWGDYPSARWSSADGSQTLATDSRTGSSYSWQIGEIIADDYRLLFGSSSAVGQRPTHMTSGLPDPRNVPGLRDLLLNAWSS